MIDMSNVTKLANEKKDIIKKINALKDSAKRTIEEILTLLSSDGIIKENLEQMKTDSKEEDANIFEKFEKDMKSIFELEDELRAINLSVNEELKSIIKQELPNCQNESILYEIVIAIGNKDISKTINKTSKSFEEIQHMLYTDIRVIPGAKNGRKEQLYNADIKSIMMLFEKYEGRNMKEALLQNIKERNLRNVGEKTIDKIESFLAEYGLNFNSDVSKYKKV